MMQPLVLGIDIGGTNTVYGIVNQRGEILHQGRISTKAHEKISSFIAALHKEINPHLQRFGIENFQGMGAGCPNGNFFTGKIMHAANLPWKGEIDMAALLSNGFKLPCVITNDANAAAFGEMMYGAAKGMKDFVMVTLGTGVGSGFVVNGQLLNGHDGFAGELGHVIVVPDGRACGCGRRGCLEAYTSATGIAKSAQELTANHKSSLSKISGNISSLDVFKAAKKGDAIALRIFDDAARLLGFALANVVAITSPEAIILFGGLSLSGNYLLAPLKKYFEDNLLSIYKGKVQITTSNLPANDAAILGASALAW